MLCMAALRRKKKANAALSEKQDEEVVEKVAKNLGTVCI
jgi:hypothetical protein